jgi:hypothetical protein
LLVWSRCAKESRQFRASVTAACQFQNASRLGVELGHISNAHTHEENPGEGDAFLTYALPFQHSKRRNAVRAQEAGSV